MQLIYDKIYVILSLVLFTKLHIGSKYQNKFSRKHDEINKNVFRKPVVDLYKKKS